MWREVDWLERFCSAGWPHLTCLTYFDCGCCAGTSAWLPRQLSTNRIASLSIASLLSSASGQVGEVWVRGPTVFDGYWGVPDATAESFAEGGWFKCVARRGEGACRLCPLPASLQVMWCLSPAQALQVGF